MAGELSPKTAIADKEVQLTGKSRLLATFADIFRIR